MLGGNVFSSDLALRTVPRQIDRVCMDIIILKQCLLQVLLLLAPVDEA
jgi:hypothetical protein